MEEHHLLLLQNHHELYLFDVESNEVLHSLIIIPCSAIADSINSGILAIHRCVVFVSTTYSLIGARQMGLVTWMKVAAIMMHTQNVVFEDNVTLCT